MAGIKGLTLLQRFNNKYVIAENGCWEWQNALNTGGYGTMSDETGKVVGAHRISYRLFVGEIEDKYLVCHTCDNRKCVSPFHFFKGTYMDNMQDCISKGRRKQRGKNKLGRTKSYSQLTFTHGTQNMYYKQNCRCPDCSDWRIRENKIRMRRYYEAKLK